MPCPGGLLTSRGGHLTANLHRLSRTTAMRSVNVPGGFADFDVREDAADAARAKVHTKTVRDALENKLLKEAQNMACVGRRGAARKQPPPSRATPSRPPSLRRSYAHWKKAADQAKPEVHEATRRHETRVHLDEIKEKVKKCGRHARTHRSALSPTRD